MRYSQPDVLYHEIYRKEKTMKGRIKLKKRTSERKFTNSALRTKKLNLSAKPRRGGIRM